MLHLQPLVLLPPFAALLIAGIGYGFQRHSVRTLEQENETLRQEIHASRRGNEGIGPSSLDGSMAQKKENTQGKPLDWKVLARRFKDLEETGGSAGLREMLQMQQQMREMSLTDLAAALDEVRTLDLPDKIKERLEYFLADALMEKDPKQVIEVLGDRLQDQNGVMPWRLSVAFQKWAEQDQAAAITWLDQQIQQGKFEAKSLDGRNPNLVRFEANLFRSLLGSDTAAAGQRIAAMAEEERLQVFQQVSAREFKPGMAQAYADLLRKHLPAQSQAEQLASASQGLMYEGDYGRVEKFLGDISATSGERSAIVERAVQTKLSLSSTSGDLSTNIGDARAWAMKQSPADADAITGAALGKMADKNFEEASRLALQYHEGGGNDEILVRFIENRPMPSGDDTLSLLVEKIRDPQRREATRAKLGKQSNKEQ